MQLLSYGRSALHDLQVEHLEVPVQERHGNVFRAHVRWVRGARHLSDWHKAPCLLFLDPKYVEFNMSQLTKPLSLHDPYGGARVHSYAELVVLGTEVGEEREDAEPLRARSDDAIEFRLAGGLRDNRLSLGLRLDEVTADLYRPS